MERHEKLQSLKPSRAVAPTIPSRRKKQVTQKPAVEKVRVKREKVQQEMTASGPFALGPAAAHRGSRISTTTTTIRQAPVTEINENEIEEKEDDFPPFEDEDNEFTPRLIKSTKSKNSVNPFGILRPKVKKQAANANAAKRAMVIDSDDEEPRVDEDTDMNAIDIDADLQSDQTLNDYIFFQLPLQLPLDSENMPDGEIGEIQIYESGRKTMTINNVVFDLQETALPDYPQEVCIIEDKDLVMIGSVGSKFVATPDFDSLLA